MDLNAHLGMYFLSVKFAGRKENWRMVTVCHLFNYGIFNDIAKEVYSHGVIAGPEGLNEDYQYNLI